MTELLPISRSTNNNITIGNILLLVTDGVAGYRDKDGDEFVKMITSTQEEIRLYDWNVLLEMR